MEYGRSVLHPCAGLRELNPLPRNAFLFAELFEILHPTRSNRIRTLATFELSEGTIMFPGWNGIQSGSATASARMRGHHGWLGHTGVTIVTVPFRQLHNCVIWLMDSSRGSDGDPNRFAKCSCNSVDTNFSMTLPRLAPSTFNSTRSRPGTWYATIRRFRCSNISSNAAISLVSILYVFLE